MDSRQAVCTRFRNAMRDIAPQALFRRRLAGLHRSARLNSERGN